MAPPSCSRCASHRAEVKRPRTGALVCKTCFFDQVEEEVHHAIEREKMFRPGDVIACGASGGKDSTVLIHLLTMLNERYQYGIEIHLVSVDEGITGYRDDSLKTVRENAVTYGLPLHILSYADLFGWTMDGIVKQVGLRNNCTYCGVLRRQALERGARLVGATTIATGHNADDNAETLLMNILRCDVPRLSSNSGDRAHQKGSNEEKTEEDSSNTTASAYEALQGLRRVKPMKDLYQKDIVLYAHHKRLVYFTTECTYAQEAYRGVVRNLIKQLEAIQPKCIASIIRSGENLPLKPLPTRSGAPPQQSEGKAVLQACPQCGAATSQGKCRACVLLASLSRSADFMETTQDAKIVHRRL